MSQPFDSNSLQTADHRVAYLSAGETNAEPIIFVHGWPELSLSWRAQLPFVSNLGYRAIAPDQRGYGGSSTYPEHADYALENLVGDMLAFIDGLNIERAIWVGHDWGSPVIWSMARHHPDRVTAIANLCVPYDTLECGWDGMLPRLDRELYPADIYPYGQWEYQRFYEEHFDAATRLFDSNPRNAIKVLFRAGSAEVQGKKSPTANTRIDGGWFGGATEVPDLPLDKHVISEADLDIYAQGLTRNGFFGPDSFYMNHAANAAYTAQAKDANLDMPVLFLHGRYDITCETLVSSLAEPMREHCSQLTEHIVDSGHWMAQEAPDAVNTHLANWLATLAKS